MASQSYASPLVIDAARSPLLRRVTVVSFLLGALAIWLSALPLPARLCLTGLLPLYLARIWRRPELGGGPVRLSWDGHGQWWWENDDGAEPMTLCGDSIATSAVTILTFRTAAGTRSVVLLPDAVEGETLRRLRVRLRLAAKGTVEN